METPYRGFVTRSLATSETRRELEPTCVLQLFLGSLLGAQGTAVGQLLFPSLITVQESLLLVSKVEKYCFRSILAFVTALMLF